MASGSEIPFIASELELMLADPTLEDYRERGLLMAAEVDKNLQIIQKQNPSGQCTHVISFHKGHCLSGTKKSVFHALKDGDEKAVALKVLDPKKNIENGLHEDYFREINALKFFKHENVILLNEVAVGNSLESMFLSLELCDCSLADVLENMKMPFVHAEIKNLMLQLLSGLEYIHGHKHMHRDINPSNLLLTGDCVLKIADFALCRRFTGSVTPKVGTLWYQAPEILFGFKEYDQSIDIWSAGCVFGEMLTNKPLFGKNGGDGEMSVISNIIDLLGTPREEVMPGFNNCPIGKVYDLKVQPYNLIGHRLKHTAPAAVEPLVHMLRYTAKNRPSASECKAFKYFKEIPLACDNITLKVKIMHNKTD